MHSAGQESIGCKAETCKPFGNPANRSSATAGHSLSCPCHRAITLLAGHDPERALACALQPTNVTVEEAEDYQPFVEQAGSQANFPNTTGTNPFALTGTVVRYLAIGGTPLNSLLVD